MEGLMIGLKPHPIFATRNLKSPQTMKLVSPLLFLLVLCLTSCSSSAYEEDAVLFENESAALTASATEMELLNLINDHRMTAGLSNLEFILTAYPDAIEHTDYMIAKGQISHDNFNTRASKIAEKTEALKVSENVAKDYALMAARFRLLLKKYSIEPLQ